MVDSLQVLQASAYIGAILGAAVAIWNLNGFARDRRTRLVLDIYSHHGTLEFSEHFMKIMNAEFSDAKEAEEKCGLVTLIMVSSYYEGVSLLIKRRLVDAALVFESLPFNAVWEKMKPWCLDRRTKLNDPTLFENIEYAAGRVRAYNEARQKRQGS
jgi:hypothetical protein